MFLRKCQPSTNSSHKAFKSATDTFAKTLNGSPIPLTNHFRRYSSPAPILFKNSPKVREQFSFIRTHFSRPSYLSDKTRHYSSTQSVFKLSETSASQLQPFLDVDNVVKNKILLQDSINKRKLARKEVQLVEQLLKRVHDVKAQREHILKQKQDNTTKFQELIHKEVNQEEKSDEFKALKEIGRQIRDELRDVENKFNEINDQLVDFILSLPNVLDKDTPETETRLLNDVKPEKVPPWDGPEYTAIETQCGPGLLAEFPVGKSAWLDIDLRGRAQAHLLDGGFIETGNAEYVKRVLLEGAGMDHSQLLKIREPNLKKGLEQAVYLAGGASFPSFLTLFAQSIIEDSSILPLRYFVIGRSYASQKQKAGFYQSHGVQVLVACRNAEEMKKEAEHLQSMMESFYSKKVGFPFQTQVVPAPRLNMYEQKKLAFVMKESEKCPSKLVGTLSIVGDYVSKRLLCCYFDDKRKAQFLHLISANFFDITHFLRSPNPKLVSHADILAREKPSRETLRFDHISDSTTPSKHQPHA